MIIARNKNKLPAHKEWCWKDGSWDQATAIKVQLKEWFIIRLLMKLVRVPCSIGNRLVGLSLYNPLSRTSSYTAKVISLKAKEIQPTKPPKAPLCCSRCLLSSLLLFTGLTTLIMAPTFLEFTSKEKKREKKTLNVIIQTATGVVFVIIWLNGGEGERLGFGRKTVGTVLSSISKVWKASGSEGFCFSQQLKYLKSAISDAYPGQRNNTNHWQHISESHLWA